ncbi:MAG: aminotransferase class I/II-fold pyridoxal phosphate-dependent enzyme, partial [Armatimonadota bacterium]
LAAQVAATAAVDDEDFATASRNANSTGFDQLTSGFDALGLPWVPSRANFVMVDVLRPCRVVFDALLRRGVIVRTGDIFGLPTMLRVTIGTQRQNERFLAELGEVLGVIPIA